MTQTLILNQQTVDVIIEYLYIKFKLYFTNENCLLSFLPKNTKIGTIIDSTIFIGSTQTLRDVVEEIVRSLTMTISCATNTKSHNKVDIAPLINFFASVTIGEVIGYDIFLS